jgi:flavin-dependent dehydrogenase
VKLDCPIIIIGAGPAGSIAATLLARAGLPVTLIEQHRFPRDKVCGECLSTVGIDVLKRAGMFDAVRDRAPVRLHRSMIHAPNGATIEFALPRPMWGISRRVLDDTLLGCARSGGVMIRQPSRIEQIERGHLTVRDLASNAVRQIESSCILVANGKSTQTDDLGIKAHFSAIDGPRDAIELFGVNGHYGGLAPVEDGSWNASFSVPAQRVRDFGGELDALFGRIISENRTLQARMRTARRVSDWLASPLPRAGVASHWPPNVIPVGNAVAALEPIGGEGMGLAMRSAELAANAIIAAASEGCEVDLDSLRARYRELWRVRSVACRAAARIASRPRLINALAGAFDGRDALPQSILHLVGKRPALQ